MNPEGLSQGLPGTQDQGSNAGTPQELTLGQRLSGAATGALASLDLVDGGWRAGSDFTDWFLVLDALAGPPLGIARIARRTGKDRDPGA
jgi:hypothetical protein